MKPARILFVSSNTGWGGSEFLWALTAARLKALGHSITAIVTYSPQNMRQFFTDGVPYKTHELFSGVTASLPTKMAAFWRARMRHTLRISVGLQVALGPRPDLVVISQGGNFDGAGAARFCNRRAIPYALISNKATETRWIGDDRLDAVRHAYANAVCAFFVSDHTWRFTEVQLGQAIGRAELVRNPYLVPWNAPPPWPANNGTYQLACVARLAPHEKGQDLLVRIMAEPRWRARPVRLTFYGSGPCERGLRDLASHLRLTNVAFAGFTGDIAAVWRDNHALLLASRGEGLPIALVEAMLCNRVPIVVDAGGVNEVVQKDETGFMAQAATMECFADTMERAWERRGEWHDIGRRAGERARTLVPADPPAIMAERLLALAQLSARHRGT